MRGPPDHTAAAPGMEAGRRCSASVMTSARQLPFQIIRAMYAADDG
jgi:hypothetical protein